MKTETIPKIFVFKFGDNDFHKTLKNLGEYLLSTVGYEVLEHIYRNNEMEVLETMFRAQLVLSQHRLDMYIDWGSKEKLMDSNKFYNESDYFSIEKSDLEFKYSYEDECDNSESLVVDFYNNKVLVV